MESGLFDVPRLETSVVYINYCLKYERESGVRILNDICESEYLRANWNNYKNANYYVGELARDTVIETTVNIINEKVGVLTPII